MKHLPGLILSAVLVGTVAPLVMTMLGVGFGSGSLGNLGPNFPEFFLGDLMIRLDLIALTLIIIMGGLASIYYRVCTSRFVAVMITALILGGLADTVHLIPDTNAADLVASHSDLTLHTALHGNLATAVVLLLGALLVRFGHGLSPRQAMLTMLGLGLALWAVSSASMAGLVSSWTEHTYNLDLLTIGLYGAVYLLLGRHLRQGKGGFLELSVAAMLVPLSVSQVWVIFNVQSINDDGFHIANLLWWFAMLLPLAGLTVDFLTSYYGRALRGERQFLRDVIDAIPHYIFTRDINGRYTMLNQGVADFYGMSVKDLVGLRLDQTHMDTEQARMWMDEDRRILETKGEWDLKEVLTHDHTGKPVWVKSIKKPLVNAGTQDTQVLGVTIDITAQRQAEEALGERLRFEQTSTTILGRFVHCTAEDFDETMHDVMRQLGEFLNTARCSLYALNEDRQGALLMRHWCAKGGRLGVPTPYLSDPEVAWLLPWFERRRPLAVSGAGGLPKTAASFRTKWEPQADQALLAVPISHNHTLTGFLVLDAFDRQEWRSEEIMLVRNVMDMYVTVWAKQETEKSLRHAIREAEASNRAKGEFLANMSHEIRTPMNCVIGISDLLQDMDPTPAQKQYLDMISQSGTSLLDVINDILDLSKIEAGQLHVDPVEINLRDAIEDVVGLIAFNAQAKGLEMVCRLSPGVPFRAVIDPTRLRQVLTNLLNNAVKFTKDGHIYLNVEPVGQKGEDLELHFEITDTGIGIPAMKLPRIFEKFTQADASTTRQFGGTGLGLSICQQLVNIMGGRIAVSSVEGEGSTFSFNLPVRVVEAQDPAAPNRPEPGGRVLVVSEHQLGGEVLAEQARALGYDCTVALGCDAAMHALQGEPGDGPWTAILVDEDAIDGKVPRISQFMNSCAPEDRPLLVLLTALSSRAREEASESIGFHGRLTKPVKPRHLEYALAGQDLPGTVATPIADRTGETEAADTKPSRQMHILLAEDNPFNQKVATGMLKILGYTTEVATNGVEAVALAQAKDFDLVFMDCQMPEMDGYEATRRIRQIEGERGRVTVIAMTANVLSGDRSACFDAGMDDFLSKPITKKKLSEMLAKWETQIAAV